MPDAEPIPIPPRDAATVVVVRDGPHGLELFCVERHRKSGFMGGALVFPGGKVDASDHADSWCALTTPLRDRSLQLADSESAARAFAIAALREALEEAAILPVTGGTLGAQAVRDLRQLLLGGEPTRSLESALRAMGRGLDTSRLEGLSRWVTPVIEPKRFDTRFYLLEMPEDQVGEHDNHETTRSLWSSPADILARWERGEVLLAPPTSWTISLFVGAESVESAFEIARSQPLGRIEPIVTNDEGEPVVVLPGDPLHPESAIFGPEVPTRFTLQNGRFVASHR